MKSICFCFQLHVPMILRNYRFFEIGQNHAYYDEDAIAAHVKQKTRIVLLPFLKMLERMHHESHGNFRAGISVPGITLQLFQNLAPEVIVLLKALQQNKCIEFLSEPWSHSLLPFTNYTLLKQEINRHDHLVEELFDVKPEILFAYTPNGSEKLLHPAITHQKNGINKVISTFTNNKKDTHKITPHLPGERRVLLIDAKNSQIFGKIDFDPNLHTLAFYVSDVSERINRNFLLQSPSIVVFNPVQKNKPFDLNQVIVWKAVIQQLLSNYEFQFLFPSQVVEPGCHPVSDANVAEKTLQHYRSTDFWLHSTMQRDVFNRQKAINRLLRKTIDSPLRAVWENVQDMDNLFFICNKFFRESFAANYFNPYSSPYLAYINYMNVLEDIHTSLKKELHHPMHYPEIGKKKRYIAAD